MKNTYWDAVEPGDVVSFIYKGQQDDAKSARRVVICLDPRLEYRKKSTNRIVDYFVGLEIFNSQKSNMFRTYFYRECRKRRVFLEDKYANLNSLQIKQITEQLIQEGQDTLIIGDDIDLWRLVME